MIIYWDQLALWNFVLDYLLLRGTLSLAGRGAERKRLLAAAAFGAAYSVAQVCLPFSPWLLLGAMAAMCAVAFGRTERYLKLTLLFLLLSCALAGTVVLLGRASGRMERVTRALCRAELPWGIFFAAAGASYLLLRFVFRGGARHADGGLLQARITCGGCSVNVTLLRDTGCMLRDPATGKSVPVVWEDAVRALLPREESAYTLLRCRTVGMPEGTLRAFRCDALRVGTEELGPRLIALSPHPLSDGAGFQGLWGGGEGLASERAVE